MKNRIKLFEPVRAWTVVAAGIFFGLLMASSNRWLFDSPMGDFDCVFMLAAAGYALGGLAHRANGWLGGS